MILVTGATGNAGSAVVRSLLDGGAAVRALVRDRARAAERLGDGVELAVGDFADRDAVRAAVTGVDRVFVASADGPDKVEHETAVIDAAATAGVDLIVKASTTKAEAGSPLPPFDWNGRIEGHLRRSGVPHVVLQSNFYMTNLLMSADQIREQAMVFAPAGEGRISMIDPRDVGEAAAAVLADDDPQTRTHFLTGPEAIGYKDVAAQLSEATGRDVVYVDVPPEDATRALAAAGLPDWLVGHLHGLFGLIRQGALEATSDHVQVLIGRRPRSFADFARERAAAFGG